MGGFVPKVPEPLPRHQGQLLLLLPQEIRARAPAQGRLLREHVFRQGRHQFPDQQPTAVLEEKNSKGE